MLLTKCEELGAECTVSFQRVAFYQRSEWSAHVNGTFAWTTCLSVGLSVGPQSVLWQNG